MIRTGLIWSVVTILAAVGLSLYGQTTIPADAQIAVHWGISGEPDRYAGKAFALWIMPAVLLGLTLLFVFIPKIEPRKAHLIQSSALYTTIWAGVMLISLAVHALVILTAQGFDLPVAQGTVAMVGLLFVLVGNLLGKSQSNFFLGFRTPWTLSSNEAWDRTHRLAGRLWVLGGLAMAAAAFLIPLPPLVYVLGAIMAAMTLVPLVASYLYWRGASDKQTGEV